MPADTLSRRIWAAHPLALMHRAALLAVARQLPSERSQVLINRAALARDLETTASLVTKALLAGETLGLCRTHRNGVVEFLQAPLPGADPSYPDGDAGQRAVSSAPADRTTHDAALTTREVQRVFGAQWEAKYGQRYVFEHPKDDRIAKTLSRQLSGRELEARASRYLTHADPWYGQCGHSFGMFLKKVNDFVVAPSPVVEDEYERAERRSRR